MCEEGLAISARFDRSKAGRWHSFVPAEYDTVLRTLLDLRERSGRFLELGSATGVVAIMADLLGFRACGIEVVPALVHEAWALARRYDSGARFAAGSFVPAGYEWVSDTGDKRMGTVGIGEPAYAKLQCELGDFDWIYAYPWPGETELLRDMLRRYADPRATLLLHGYGGAIELYSVN